MLDTVIRGAEVLNPNRYHNDCFKLRYAGETWFLDDRDREQATTRWVTLPRLPFHWAAYRKGGQIYRMPHQVWMEVSRASHFTDTRYAREQDSEWELFTP